MTFMKALTFIAILIAQINCTSSMPKNNLMMQAIPPPENQLTARYFGASTILISDGDTSILIDGFFSRPTYVNTIIHGMKPNNKTIKSYLEDESIDKVDLILISHPHYDHARDAGCVARARNATIYGTKSAICIIDNKTIVLETHDIDTKEPINLGLFSITVYATPHAKKKSILRFLETTWLLFSHGLSYKNSDKEFSFLINHPKGNILVVPSAGYESGILPNVEADIVFLSIGLLGNRSETYIKNYWDQTVTATHAKLVIPIHWDSLQGDSLTPTPDLADNLEKSIRLITKFSKNDIDNPVLIRFPLFKTIFSLDIPP